MIEPTQKPVIFLAFANDREQYLHNLHIEQRGIREAMKSAREAGLCEVVERNNTTIRDLFDVFQEYQDRVAVFHYGGHADDYLLLLESEAGERAIANSGGLISFLAKQKGLQLVFINGCSSKQQALDLSTAGVPAVVGTAQPIDDAVATDLAARFYKGLATGATIDRAWAAAVDQMKTQKSEATFRALSWKGKSETHVNFFPWEIYYRQGAEIVKDWNLPEAVENPLFGLPEIPKTYDLPETPFLFLKRYERQHAEIFFGRSYYIRDLYNRVSDPNSPPVILLYGQSGVGKSSLFDAGLNPRLEKDYKVIYIRRIQEKGLAGTLAFVLEQELGENGMGAVLEAHPPSVEPDTQAHDETLRYLEAAAARAEEKLKQDIDALIQRMRATPQHNFQNAPSESKNPLPASSIQHPASLLEQWQHTEAQSGKPLIVILDQVEELFTRPNPELPDELADLLLALRNIFGSPAQRPSGRLILGYRKEYHPEIEEGFKTFLLPRATVFLEPLRRKDILEIFRGVSHTPGLEQRYNLSVEEALPVMLADDLLEDKESPVAPVLQIVLTKLWNAASKENAVAPRFTVEQYQRLKKDGIAMGEFFEQQMQQLRRWNPGVVDSGLALDVLHFHITALGTAGTRSLEELRQTYQHRQDLIDSLVGKCKELYLLTEAQHSTAHTSLTHDTLAPVVNNEFNNSDKPGQRAARILNSKMSDFNENGSAVWLDEADLAIVEQGNEGMRRLFAKEDELLKVSREKRRQRQRLRKQLWAGGVVMLVGIIATAILAFVQMKNAEKNQADAIKQAARADSTANVADRLKVAALDSARVANEQRNRADESARLAQNERARAEKEAQYSKSLYLASKAADLLQIDNTKAIRVAEAAYRIMQQDPPTQVSRTLVNVFYGAKRNSFYQRLMHEGTVNTAVFSPDGRTILSASDDSTAILWSAEYQLLKTLQCEAKVVSAFFSPNGQTILTHSSDNKITLWALDGSKDEEITAPAEVRHVKFSPDGHWVVVAMANDTAGVWSRNGKLIRLLPHEVLEKYSPHNVNLLFSPDGSRICSHSKNDYILVWNVRGNEVETSPDTIRADRYIVSACFSPDGDKILTASWDRTVRLWSRDGTHKKFLHQKFLHPDMPTDAVFFSSGDQILTHCIDKSLRIWSVSGNETALKTMQSLRADASALTFSPDGKYFYLSTEDSIAVFTASGDRLAKFVNRGEPLQPPAFSSEAGRFVTFPFDRNVVYLWSSSGDTLGNYQLPKSKSLNTATLSPDGEKILVAAKDSSVYVFPRQNEYPWSIKVDGGREDVRFSDDGSRLLISSSTGHHLWSLEGKKEVDEFDNERISTSTISPDKKFHINWLYTRRRSGLDTLRVSTSEGDSIVKDFYTRAAAVKVSFLHDSKRILFYGGKVIKIFTLDQKLLFSASHAATVNDVRFSPDSLTILSASADSTARLWDLNGKEIRKFPHQAEVEEATFSLDGTKILTSAKGSYLIWTYQGKLELTLSWQASLDRTIRAIHEYGKRFVELKSNEGENLGTIPLQYSGYRSPIISQDGLYMATSEGDGVVRVWPTARAIYAWLQKADISQLSKQEKREYGIQ